MRELWVKVSPSLGKKEKIELIEKTKQISSAFIVEPDDIKIARESGAKTVVSKSDDADIKLVSDFKALIEAKKLGKKTCINIVVKSKGDEKLIVDAAEASTDYVAAECPDWKVIPLENLIAKIHGKTMLLMVVSNFQETKIALETLEIGADGVVADLSDLNEIIKVYEALRSVKTRAKEIELTEKITLQSAKITEIRPLGSGARVCIDTCDLMTEGEGMLVGCQSSGLFLVEAEVHETQFVASRPFRVNAGSIALYVLAPGGKTRYLSELKAGDEVLIVDQHGRSRSTNICRVKIEWRPLILIEAECEGRRARTILQNAETIRLVTEEGSKSVKDLNVGEAILVHLEEGGRHFGTLVKEERVIER